MKKEKIPQELLALRASIDNFDAALVHILAERFRCTREIGALKAHYGLALADHDREKYQIERLRMLAKAADLDPDFAEKFLNFVIRNVIRSHEDTAAEYGGSKNNE